MPEVPKQLPPTLIASLQHVGTPIRTPTGAMSPTESYKQFLTQQPATVVPIQQQQIVQPIQTQAMVQPQAQIQPAMIQSPPNMMMNQGIPMQQQMMMMSQQQQQPINNVMQASQPMIQTTIAQQIMSQPQTMQMTQMPQVMPQTEMIYQPQQTVIPQTASVMPQMQQQMYATPVIPQQPARPPLPDHPSSGSLLENLAQVPPTVAPSSVLPAAPTPTPPQSGHASRSMSFSEKAPSIPESP